MGESLALLLTDVVDSTRLNDVLGDAVMSPLWEAHDRAARGLIQQWNGREIARSDGFLVLFAEASDAVGFALAYHRALAGLSVPLKARVGIHVGPVALRENAPQDRSQGAPLFEVDGVALPLAARVMSAAVGGQTLTTAATVDALGHTSHRLQAHGHWQMKGVQEPVALFEVGEADAPLLPPPDSAKAYRVVRVSDLWLPRRQVRHTLPAERDAFVGRDAPLQDLARRIEGGARLVSVLGIGGTGKTRFATRFGWTWLGEFPGGVWFCDLSHARALDGIVHAVAQGLDVPLGSAEPVAHLGQAIAGRGRCLVILDNFEQLVRHAAATVGCWLDMAGEACFIVTTRDLLGLPGEQALPLAPLAAADGADLFVRRAAAALPEFSPSADDHAAIGTLVGLLDGLPLAIELAAARIRVMPPRMLVQRMSERFKLLATPGGRHPRQATLRGALDWSWDLLRPYEKAALAQLSVFAGGFTVPAAEAVLDLSSCADAPWTLDVLHSLANKSMIRRVGEQRFDMLASVLEYAAEHLDTEGGFPRSGPAATTAVRARHGRYFAAMDEMAATADACAEADNLVAACRRAVDRRDTTTAIGALFGAWAVLRLRGPFRAAIELADAVGAMGGLDADGRALVEWVAGSALNLLGGTGEATARLEAGLVLTRTAGNRTHEALLLCELAEQPAAETEAARAQLQQALALARECDDRTLQCRVLNGMGALASDSGRIAEAQAHYEAALDIARELKHRRWEGGLLGNLATLDFGAGRMEDARRRYESALRIAEQIGDRRWEGNTRCNLGLLLHELGQTEEARFHFELALTMAREMGHRQLESTVLCNLGIVTEALGVPEQALGYIESAVSIAGELRDQRGEGQFRTYLGPLYARLGRLNDAFNCLRSGEAMFNESSDTLSLALLLCARAEVAQLAGDSHTVAVLLRQVETIIEGANVGPDSEPRRALARVRSLVEQGEVS